MLPARPRGCRRTAQAKDRAREFLLSTAAAPAGEHGRLGAISRAGFARARHRASAPPALSASRHRRRCARYEQTGRRPEQRPADRCPSDPRTGDPHRPGA